MPELPRRVNNITVPNVASSVCDQEPCLVARVVRVDRDSDRLPRMFMFSNLLPPGRLGLCHLWSHFDPNQVIGKATPNLNLTGLRR